MACTPKEPALEATPEAMPEMVRSAAERIAEANQGAAIIQESGGYPIFVQQPIAALAVHRAFRDGVLAERARSNPERDELVEALAKTRAEVDRLNKWADGFSDAQLKERRLCEELLRERAAENKELVGALDRITSSLNSLIAEVTDPGTEALAAEYCARSLLSRIRSAG